VEDLYIKYNRTIFKYIFYLTQNEHLAEDFLQETFLRAFRNRYAFRNDASDITWLRKIARNIVYDYYRRKKIIQFIPFINKHEPSEPDIAMNYILQSEERNNLFYCLSKLKLIHRDVLILRKIEGLSLEDTATILGWNLDKVKNTQRAAIRNLKEIWKGVVEDDE